MVSNSIYTFNGIDTDHLVKQEVRVPGSNVLVDKAYTYDALGNMLSRKTGYGTLASETAIAPITEAFQYDRINRLTGYQMVGGVSGSNINTQVQYDRIGNITFKSDVGSYSYDPARPYRLTQVALSAPSAAALLPSANKALDMLYDDGLPGAKSNGGVLMGNGNLRCTVIANSDGTRQARWQTYTSFNAPTQIALKTVDANFSCPANGALPTSPSTQLQFVYSPEHQRVKQMVTGGAQAGTTYYYNGNDSLDLSYEKSLKANGVTEHKHYISLPGSNGQWLLGQLVQRSGNLAANPAISRAAEELNYFHQDAQGSTVAVSDANGQTLERMAYDPWGDRRSVTGPADPNNLITAEKTDRGYTQHEMLDEVGLVHMNGRIYDPTLGRMLTTDILVSYPERSTSYNRYAYALNNPLRFIDPTGWDVEDSMPNNPSGNYFVGGSGPLDNGSQSIDVVKTLSETVKAGVNAGLQAIRAQMHLFADNHPEGDSIDVLRPFASWVRNGGVNPPDESSVSGVFGKIIGENAGLLAPAGMLGRSIKSKKTVDSALNSASLKIGEGVKSKNGLFIKSNDKHVPGKQGYHKNAGTEPANAFELFDNSVPDPKDPIYTRYSVDFNGELHRYSFDSVGTYHWSGSTVDAKVPLRVTDISKEIRRLEGVAKDIRLGKR